MARLLEVLKALPVAPRLLIALATGVEGGESISATARILFASAISAVATSADCEYPGAMSIFAKNPIVPKVVCRAWIPV